MNRQRRGEGTWGVCHGNFCKMSKFNNRLGMGLKRASLPYRRTDRPMLLTLSSLCRNTLIKFFSKYVFRPKNPAESTVHVFDDC